MTQNSDEDINRLTLFPTMDYRGLFETCVLLIDDANLIHIGFQGATNFFMFVFMCERTFFKYFNITVLFFSFRICSINFQYFYLLNSVLRKRSAQFLTLYSSVFVDSVSSRNAQRYNELSDLSHSSFLHSYVPVPFQPKAKSRNF